MGALQWKLPRAPYPQIRLWGKVLYQTDLKLQEMFSNSQAISIVTYFE